MDTHLFKLARHACALTPAVGAAVIRPLGGGDYVVVASAGTSSIWLGAGRSSSASPVARCFDSGERVWQTYDSEDTGLNARHAQRSGARASLALPIRDESDRLVGVLVMGFGEPQDLTTEAERVLQSLAELAAVALEDRSGAGAPAEAEALREVGEREARFRAFIDAGPAVAWIKDPEGRFTFINARFELLWKLRAGDLLGKTDFDFLPAAAAEAVRRNDAEVARTGLALTLEEEVPTPDGQTRWWLSYKFPIDAVDGRRSVGGVAIEITARKTAVAELAASRQRLSALLEHAPIGVFETNAEGRTIQVNPRWRRITGLTEAQALAGGSWQSLMDPADYRPLMDEWSAANAAQREFSAEISLHVLGHARRVRAASVPLFDEHGKLSGQIGTIQDVTAEHEAREVLRRSEENFRAVVEASSEGILVHRAGGIVYANAAMRRLAAAGDIVGRRISEFVVPEDYPEVERRVAALAAGKPVGAPASLRIARGDGALAYVEVTAARIDYDGGPATAAVVRDVTERRSMLVRLQIAERMASVGTMAAGVAHEINNPLSYVVANLAMLAEHIVEIAGASPSGRLREMVELVAESRHGAERVRRIVRSLKTFSRSGDTEQRVPLDVREVLNVAIRMAGNEMRHRASIRTEFGAVPLVIADETRLAQLFVNLLVNAAQALPDGAADRHAITIRTATTAGGGVLVEVSDTGKGIAPEIIGRIFDPFFTTKAVGVGTGLGLSICHGIVSALGGSIAVESGPGIGTTFRVVLPAGEAPETVVGAETEVIARAPPGARRGRVLIVDDEPLIGRAVARFLGDEHEVILVDSGGEALERLAEGSFDLILSDLMMPQMSGIELYREIARRFPEHLRQVVFMTGGAFSDEARAFLAAAPNQRIDKPLDMVNLRALTAQFVRERTTPDLSF